MECGVKLDGMRGEGYLDPKNLGLDRSSGALYPYILSKPLLADHWVEDREVTDAQISSLTTYCIRYPTPSIFRTRSTESQCTKLKPAAQLAADKASLLTCPGSQ